MQKFRLSFCLACFLWLGVATVGKGQVISTTAGLATAVANLTSGQTLHLAPATTFQLTDKLDINQSCTIDGHGATIKFSTSATLAQDLLFDIGSGVTITLKNINLEGKGNSVTTPSEALQFYNGNVTLEGCEIHNFYPTSSGAGAISGGGTGDLLKVKDCYIHDNGLRGIYNSSAGFTDFEITNSTFANHSESAIRFQHGGSSGTGTYNVSNCTFLNNGVAIEFTMSHRTIEVSHCTIYGGINSVSVGGSGIIANIQNSILTGYSGTSAVVTFGGTANTSTSIVSPPSTSLAGLSPTLTNKGGFAPVLPIISSSCPAVNATTSTTGTDQRNAQANGTRDKGAYEFEGEYPVNSPALTVYNTNPFGFGSLYQAIVNANNNSTTSTITFNIDSNDINYQASTNHWRIQPITHSTPIWSTLIKDTGHLPNLTRTGITIDGGTSQSNGNTIFGANNALLRIELNGALASSNGLVVDGASCAIENLNINSFNGNGILIKVTADGSTVRGCFIGTDIRGNTAMSNTSDGIFINGASNVKIGGTLTAFQNIISGNGFSGTNSTGYGISIAGGEGNQILGNVIGLNALKSSAIPNGIAGIAINGSNGAISTKIGDAVPNDLSSNLISGNTSNGIYIVSSSNINIYKNYVGIKGDGSVQGNGSEGIRIEGTSSNINIGAIGAGNVVGGNSTDNIILFENGGAPNGIDIVGNHIGIGADGITPLGGGRGIELLGVLTRNVYISQNVIACNLVKGIGLNYLLSTANESIAPPVITEALTTRVSGTANAGANVEIYVDNSTCSTGSKQGSVYLGTTTANASTGAWTFNTDLLLRQGQHITAIQHAGTNNKNTSEFSTSKTVNYLPTSANITVGNVPPLVLEDVVFDLNSSLSGTFADVDATDTFWGVKIENLPANGYGNLRYLDASGNPVPVLVVAGNTYKLSTSPTATTERLVYTSDGNGNITTAPVTFSFRIMDSKQEASATANTVTIVVTPVNDLPTSANINIGINAPLVLEDTDFALSQVSFPFDDAEDVALSRLQIVTLPTKGTLLFDGSAVTANQIIPASDLPLLKYKSALNENGASYTTFTFKVIDSQAGASDLTHTATIHVTAVNDAPVIDAIPITQPFSISKNSNDVELTLTGIGAGGGTDELIQAITLTATSSLPNIIANPILAYTSPNPTATLMFSVLQAVTQNTDVTIKIVLRDNGGTLNNGVDSTVVTFQVKVVPNLLTPYNLSATVASASSIQLAWEDDNTNVTGYEIYRTTTSETNPFQLIGTSTSKSYTDDVGLVIGTYYIYRVQSISSIGYSEYSNLGAVELANVSASPTNLQASVQANVYDAINLTWTDNSNDEEGFRLERKSVFSDNFFEEVAILPANTTAYTDTELLPNVKYTYRLRSFNDNGQPSAYSNQVVIATNINPQMPAPLPPFDLEAVSVSTRQINLSWEYNINPDVVYSVSRSTDGTNFNEIAEFVTASLSSVKSYIDTVGLVQGTLYYYKVRASTGGGLSAYSNVDTARAICNLQDLAIVRIDNGKEVICEGKSAAMSIVSEVAGATYQWKRNGVTIADAKFDTFYASQTGVYTCTIVVDNCQATSVNSLFVAVLNEPEALTVVEQNGELLASINDADGYQWYYDYRPIAGATSRNYKPTNAGVYYVVATVENCVSTSDTYFYAVLGNENVNISQYIHLAPNPARLQTEVRFALPTMGDYAIEVLDTKGKAWLQTAGKKTDMELRQTLSLAKVPAGVYLIKLRIGNQQGYKKLVVSE